MFISFDGSDCIGCVPKVARYISLKHQFWILLLSLLYNLRIGSIKDMRNNILIGIGFPFIAFC